MGHIYVIGGDADAYEIAGGPPPGKGSKGPGGHSAGVTPAGHYILGSGERHTTSNWPASTVPWGAKLRLAKDGEIEFFQGTWKRATGSDGVTTQALLKFYQRTPGTPVPSSAILNQQARSLFFDATGKLLPEWNRNDFGKWSWNLKTLAGLRTAYYIHTTPENEAATAAPEGTVLLEQSHGCVHIRPKDRDKMMRKGYLQPGLAVEVRRYGVKGPPR